MQLTNLSNLTTQELESQVVSLELSIMEKEQGQELTENDRQILTWLKAELVNVESALSKRLKDGTVVRLYGYHLEVSEIKDCGINGFGQRTWKFTGKVLNSVENRLLPETGRFSYRVEDNNIVSQPN